MDVTYQKVCYDDAPTYQLHHTVGYHAGDANPAHLHYDSTMILTYFKHGSGNIKIEGKRYEIHSGDVILLNPGELHCCTIRNDQYHERIVLYLHESVLDPFSCDKRSFFDAFYHRSANAGNLISQKTVKGLGIDTALVDLLRLCQSSNSVNRILALCKIVELLAKLREVEGPEAADRDVPTVENPIVGRALQYLNLHFREPLSLEAVAAECYTSKYHLCRLFKECVGTTPWNYVIFRRITAFNRLVQELHLPLEQACYAVGFNNYSNFYRLYKKHTGNAPTQLKKN
ncbi:MAG: helix-turn-helix transcriptional regulator [Clostridia bacterium]|nr:helix-turn-helix transcriptional regulator [Clostridia bacterium]